MSSALVFCLFYEIEYQLTSPSINPEETMSSLSQQQLLKIFSGLVAAGCCLSDSENLKHYGRDWTTAWEPSPALILLPSSTEEVQAIVRAANEHRVALVPSGGRTGLSGGAVAAKSEVVVVFDHMNQLREFNPVDRTVVCQAGVVTGQLQAFAERQDLVYPVDFASAGSSQLGGNISTNAGGVKVIRYGTTRHWVAGLKVVTGKGDVLDLNKGLVKNATGYDLRHLFIGAECSLGFVVEATMQLASPPQASSVLVLGVPDFVAMMNLLDAFRQAFDLMAFEFFSDRAMNYVLAQGGARPFEGDSPLYALLEIEHVGEKTLEEILEVFERMKVRGWVEEGVMSQSQEQARALWQLREGISESIASKMPYKNDLSVTVSKLPAFIEELDEVVRRVYPDIEAVWYGHLGDGNLHLNILKPDDQSQENFFQACNEVNRHVFETVEKYGGSVSAEHGVGLLKKPHLNYTRSAIEIEYMKGLKAVFDPNGIMNPGKLI
jgi:FAD/FMN-containing dehydrogenase